MFTSQDLAEIAQRLDELESEQLDQAIRAGESQNYDDSGFFSIMGACVFKIITRSSSH